MKKKILTLTFLFLLTLIGCNKKETLSFLFDGKDTYMKSNICNIKSDAILAPVYTVCINNHLVCSNVFETELIRVYDLASGEVISDLISKGQGPGELIDVSSLYLIGDEIMIYSANSQRIIKINSDELTKPQPEIITQAFPYDLFNLIPLEDRYIGTGNISGYMFELLDSNANQISSFGSFPEDNIANDIGTKRIAYQGKAISSPAGNYIVYGSSFGQIFKFMEVQGNSFKLIKEYTFALPDYMNDSHPQNDSYSVIYKNECIVNTLCLAASSRYCFILCEDGNQMSDNKWESSTIYVFDWQGNPITKLNLDRTLEAISYNDYDHSIIGKSSDEKGEPIFVSYKLDI